MVNHGNRRDRQHDQLNGIPHLLTPQQDVGVNFQSQLGAPNMPATPACVTVPGNGVVNMFSFGGISVREQLAGMALASAFAVAKDLDPQGLATTAVTIDDMILAITRPQMKPAPQPTVDPQAGQGVVDQAEPGNTDPTDPPAPTEAPASKLQLPD